MDLPGARGVTEDPEALDRAEEEQEKLLEELKKAVKADVKEIGVLRKEIAITVPAKIIADHMEQNYSDLMHDAQVPGFRKGRAPRRLIEKRFGSDVRESLTTSIVGQSFYAVTENEELDVLGDPRFRIEADEGVKLVEIDEALQHIKLPEEGNFSYVCEVELKPTFELPELTGIEIKTPEIKITDEMVDERILQRRKNRGRLELVSDGAKADDQLTTDVVLSVDGEEIKREDNLVVGVRPTALEGIPLVELDKSLTGVKPDESITVECTIPPDFERADLRGKPGQFTFKIHEIKRLAPESLESFLGAWGFETEQEARGQFHEELEAERDQLMERAKKAQVEEYLLQNTKLDLPEDFSARQVSRAVVRQIVELQQQGVPMSDIEARIDELRTSASERVGSELKLSFVLEKVAEERDVHVTDEEVNTEIARIAQLYNRRFDRVRDELQSRDLLKQLIEQIRHNKCVALLLADAKVVAADRADKKQPKAKKTAKKKAGAKKTAKKKTTKESE